MRQQWPCDIAARANRGRHGKCSVAFSAFLSLRVFRIHWLAVRLCIQGKRSCMGEQLARQEIFLFAATLLQQFDIRPPEGKERIDDTWKFAHVVAPLPFKIRFIPRY